MHKTCIEVTVRARITVVRPSTDSVAIRDGFMDDVMFAKNGQE